MSTPPSSAARPAPTPGLSPIKPIDRWLRDARIARALPYVNEGGVVLDVGCGDGEFVRRLTGRVRHAVGIEPALTEPAAGDGWEMLPGRFPDDVPAGLQCDTITMLAVVEHIPPEQAALLDDVCRALLRSGGRVVITVPSPSVDHILHAMIRLRLIAGMAVHQHFGFRPSQTAALFPPPNYRLIRRSRFQFGLNNLFVFEKVS